MNRIRDILNKHLFQGIFIGMLVILVGIVLTNVRANKRRQASAKEPAAA